MGKRKPRTDLPAYFKGISRRLQLQVELMTPVIVHNGEMGGNDHGWFAEIIRQYLPKKFGVDTGFIVNKDSDKGSFDFFSSGERRTQDNHISAQMDILILDVLHNAPFCVEKTFAVCPIEMVLGAVEVTRDLTEAKLRTDCKKLSQIKEMAEKRVYAGNYDLGGNPPITFAVGLTSKISEEKLLKIVTSMEPKMMPNGIFLLSKGFYWFSSSSNY